MIALEPENVSSVIKQGSIIQRFLEKSKNGSVNVVVFVLFCFEGNNTIEALAMADCLDNVFHLRNKEPSAWVTPRCWSRMETMLLDKSIIF